MSTHSAPVCFRVKVKGNIFEEGYIYLLWIPWQYWSLAPPVCEQNFRSAFAFSHTANIIQCPKYSVFQCTLLHLGHSIAVLLCTSVEWFNSIVSTVFHCISLQWGLGNIRTNVLNFYPPKSCFRILSSIQNLNQYLEL